RALAAWRSDWYCRETSRALSSPSRKAGAALSDGPPATVARSVSFSSWVGTGSGDTGSSLCCHHTPTATTAPVRRMREVARQRAVRGGFAFMVEHLASRCGFRPEARYWDTFH